MYVGIYIFLPFAGVTVNFLKHRNNSLRDGPGPRSKAHCSYLRSTALQVQAGTCSCSSVWYAGLTSLPKVRSLVHGSPEFLPGSFAPHQDSGYLDQHNLPPYPLLNILSMCLGRSYAKSCKGRSCAEVSPWPLQELWTRFLFLVPNHSSKGIMPSTWSSLMLSPHSIPP